MANELEVKNGLKIDGDVVATDKYIHLGDPNTDGTWRIKVNGTALEFDRRAAGVYNTVGSFD